MEHPYRSVPLRDAENPLREKLFILYHHLS